MNKKINWELIKENVNNREIVVWGAKKADRQEIENLLVAKYGSFAFFVDSNLSIRDGIRVKSPESLREKQEKYYVLVVTEAYYRDIEVSLLEYGFVNKKDYLYPAEDFIEKRENYIEDKRHNIIKGESGLDLNVVFRGESNKVQTSSMCDFNNVSISVIGKDNEIKISAGCNLNNVSIQVQGEKNVILIGSNCMVNFQRININGSGQLIIGDNCKIHAGEISSQGIINIGDYTTIQWRNMIVCDENREITIGRDCMFSYDLRMRTGDGHAIFDKKTNENYEYEKVLNNQKNIFVGNHVWIAMDVMILGGANVQNNTIIGAKSLVNKKIEENSIAVGCPASVVKQDIEWARNENSHRIEDCVCR